MKSKRPAYILGTVLIVLLLGWNLYLEIQPNHTSVGNLTYAWCYDTLYILAAFFGLQAVARASDHSLMRRALLLISVGTVAFSIADAMWDWFYLHNMSPFPSIADALFFAYPILVAIGVLTLLRIYAPLITRTVLIQSAVIVAVAIGLAFYYLVVPKFDAGSSLLANIFNMMYSAVDALLIICVLITLRVSGGRIHRQMFLMICSTVLMFTSDFVFAYRTSNGTYFNADLSDVFYALSGYVLLLSILSLVRNLENSQQTAAPATLPPVGV